MMDPKVVPVWVITEKTIMWVEGSDSVSFGYQSSPQELWKE